MPESSMMSRLDYELNGDQCKQIAEVERKNREESTAVLSARDLVARVVANHREMVRQRIVLGRSRAGPRKPRRKEYSKRKPYKKRLTVSAPTVTEPHWGDLLLEYVRKEQ